jgi:hypothetical protein
VRIHRSCLLVLLLALPACELREVTVADARDVIVAEVILCAGAQLQTAYLHRTNTGTSVRVLDAVIHVTEVESGSVMRFEAGADSLCIELRGSVPGPGVGTCYVARGGTSMVRPGARYTLSIELEDGRAFSGATTVPGAFELVQPREACRLAPAETLDLVWTQSDGAWVYLVETRLERLLEALRAAGVAVPQRQGAVELLGLSIGASDTTMAFPTEIGLFSRADPDLHPILLAIRDGLPPDVTASIAVAAADRNYVNWIRGGSFNPSGTVRVPSLSGAGGTGVFGSLVVRRTALHTTPGFQPACR